MNMTNISNSVVSKVARFGSVVALSAAFIVGVSSPASAQGYRQNGENNRDWHDSYDNNENDRDWHHSHENNENGRDWHDSHQYNENDRDWRDDGGQRGDRYGRFNDRRLGRDRHYYSYNGRSYDYTVDNRRGSRDAREVAQQASRNGYEQGIQDGQYDARFGASRPNPVGHGAYQFALDGWSQDWGSGNVYQSAYRQAYVRGYNEVFSRSQRPGRRY